MPLALRARWVVPIDRPPVEGGVVTIAAGRIAAVDKNVTVRPPRDLGDVALLPALVNAHTHLDLSDLTAPLGWPGISFPDWIKLVVKHRRTVALLESKEQLLHSSAAVAKGLAECSNHGVGAV